jgi:hypothetical protein
MADEMAEYLAARDEWERLVAEWATTGKPGDAMPGAVKLAEARVDALKAAAGEGGPGDPLCCQRYGRLHRPTFSVPGCRWYEMSQQRAYSKLTAAPFGISAGKAEAALKYALRLGARRLVEAGHDIGIRYDTAHGFRVYDLTKDAEQEEYTAAFGDPA